jgi:hypothetical protein
MTSAGLAEHIKRECTYLTPGPELRDQYADLQHKPELHLFEYHQTKLEYLQYFAFHAKKQQSTIVSPTLSRFSDPDKVDGYNDKSITDDLITDIYLGFSDQTRRTESQEYIRTLTGE